MHLCPLFGRGESLCMPHLTTFFRSGNRDTLLSCRHLLVVISIRWELRKTMSASQILMAYSRISPTWVQATGLNPLPHTSAPRTTWDVLEYPAWPPTARKHQSAMGSVSRLWGHGCMRHLEHLKQHHVPTCGTPNWASAYTLRTVPASVLLYYLSLYV